jgi:predicted DCC family thiol-disulfide oxidoreductase YuxK
MLNLFTKIAVELPDPDDCPDCPVVIWDGQCNFCRRQVTRLRWFDGRSRLSYISLHDPRVASRYPELSYQQLMDQLWVVTRENQKYGGADAFRFLSRYLPRMYWLAPLMHIPGMMPTWRWLYATVARRRYAIAGKNCSEGTCHLHATPAKNAPKTSAFKQSN